MFSFFLEISYLKMGKSFICLVPFFWPKSFLKFSIKNYKSRFEKLDFFLNSNFFSFSHSLIHTFVFFLCAFRGKLFDVGGVIFLVLGFILNMQLINCFWKTRVVLKRAFKCFTAVVLKKTDCRQVQYIYC